MRMLWIVLATVAMFSHKDAYVISTGNNSTLSGASVEELVAVRKRIPARSIWVRRGGHEYVIVDETVRRRALALFAPQMALESEQEAVGREEAALDREADRLEDLDTRTEAQKQRLRDLHAQLKVVSRREKELDEREEELERQAERQLWPLLDEAIRSGLAKPPTR